MGCGSRRDLQRHFRGDIFVASQPGRARRCSWCFSPTGAPARLHHPGTAQGTCPTPSLPHHLPGRWDAALPVMLSVSKYKSVN